MQEKHLFEYATIRYVPRVEREEFLNIGVILYCPSLRFLQTTMGVNKERLHAFSPGFEIEDLEKHLVIFEKIGKGGPEGGTIGMLPLSSRFRWLTATRSTIVQTSTVHLGLCKDPEETLARLYDQQVK